jgi:hypothetical protein
MNNKSRVFFIVMNRNGRMPTVQHDTLELAIKEAERLARINPGDKFEVFKWEGSCAKNTVSWEYPEQLEHPF